jgi:serine/threonine protein kinase
MRCPTPDELKQFALAPESPPDSAVAAHVRACEACGAAVERLRTDGDVDDAPQTATQNDLTRTATPETAYTSSSIPETVGDVDILRLLGKGGMGSVYLGRDRMLSRDVAVKFLLNVVAGEDDPRFEEFLHGARQAAKLRHPNLVTLYQASLTESVPYLVMEYIDGPTLRDLLRVHGGLPVAVAVRIMRDVASAVAALHESETVHRDIKPANILFDREGHLFVTDFGLSCDRPKGQGDCGRQGKVAGTPAYMSPEMFRGTVSVRSDVYALGIMFYELLAGRLPFVGSFAEIRRQHEQDAPDAEPLRARDVPAELIEIIERAAHKREMFRFKTAREFGRALELSSARSASDAQLQGYVLLDESDKDSANALPGEADHSDSSSYFDRLTQIASAKLAARDDTDRERAHALPADEDAIELELPCVDCGYLLKGLSARGRCPECGAPVARSLKGQLLTAASLSWLRRINKGLSQINAALLCALLGAFAGLILGGVLVTLLGDEGMSLVKRAVPYFQGLLGAAFIALAMMGILNVTALEPRLSLSEGTTTLRRCARISGVVAVVLFLSDLILASVPWAWVTAATNVARGVALLAMMFFGLLYLRHLVARIPQPKLARSCYTCAMLLLFTGSLTQITSWLQATQSAAGLGPLLTNVLLFMVILLMVAAFWALHLLGQIRRAMRAVIEQVRQRSNSAGPHVAD